MKTCNFFDSNELDTNRKMNILLKDWKYSLVVQFMKVPFVIDLNVYIGIQTSESDVVVDKIEWSTFEKIYPYEITFKMDKQMDIEQITKYIKSKLINI